MALGAAGTASAEVCCSEERPHGVLPGETGERSEDGCAPWRHGDGFLCLALNCRLGTRVLSTPRLVRQGLQHGGRSVKGVSERIRLTDLGCPQGSLVPLPYPYDLFPTTPQILITRD